MRKVKKEKNRKKSCKSLAVPIKSRTFALAKTELI